MKERFPKSVTCHYDGQFCQAKETHFKKWVAAVEFNAREKRNYVFIQGDDDMCPLGANNHLGCERFVQYQIQKAMAKTK